MIQYIYSGLQLGFLLPWNLCWREYIRVISRSMKWLLKGWFARKHFYSVLYCTMLCFEITIFCFERSALFLNKYKGISFLIPNAILVYLYKSQSDYLYLDFNCNEWRICKLVDKVAWSKEIFLQPPRLLRSKRRRNEILRRTFSWIFKNCLWFDHVTERLSYMCNSDLATRNL